MGASPTPRTVEPLPARAGTAVPPEPGRVVAIAYSGGRDSLALLHATCRAAAPLGLQVVALHVHHGLQPDAHAWLRQARRLCARWRRRGWPLQLRWARLEGAPAPGDSVEAWARRGRRAALDRMARESGATLLLLAHHRRDQAETLLLQALRGGGPAGLSAMPAVADRAGLAWARPWLDQPREAIDAYVQRHRLQPVHDPSNDDLRLARSRLRQQVWPALTAAFGDAEATLAAAARRAQEAAAALAELAAIDLAPLVDDQGRLQFAGWRALSAARQANTLRAWWALQSGHGARQALVDRVLAEAGATAAAWWPAGGGWVCRLYRGRLRVVPPDAGLRPPAEMGVPRESTLDLSRPGRWPAPGWSGAFEVAVADPAAAVRGLPPGLLCAVQLRPRSGGEQFQARPGSPPRSLKKQFQAAALPAQQRCGPLLWSSDGALLFVPGLGADARQWAAAGTSALTLRWCGDPAPSGSHLSGQESGPDKAAG
ncbi:MAG: tRNA lysidine(34) synthetase TilS [Burkholderiaceae bacterium]|nr:tRNA lysidine(34) synthetase TilS [Burkholderiaceae bacterium]